MSRPCPFRALLPLLFAGPLLAAEPPVDLRCEYLTQPLAVESPAPRLSWRLRDERRGAAQTAWRVIVASSAERAAIQPACSATGVTAVKPPHAVRRAPCCRAPLDQLTTPTIRSNTCGAAKSTGLPLICGGRLWLGKNVNRSPCRPV